MDWPQILEELSRGYHALPSVVAALVLMWCGRWVFRWTVPFGPGNAGTGDEHRAAWLVYGGFILALAVASRRAYALDPAPIATPGPLDLEGGQA